MRQVFSDIHMARAWGGTESASGPGSTRERASDFLGDLIGLLRDLRIASLLDAPCGDFNWTAPVADAVGRYVGVDVVRDIIRENRRRHGSPAREFLIRDFVHDRLPRADLVLCRDGLVHLTNAECREAIGNMARSGATFLFATTFVGDRENDDIRTGDWRPLNLERAPFRFPAPLKVVDEHCLHTGGIFADKRLGLWRLDDLKGIGVER